MNCLPWFPVIGHTFSVCPFFYPSIKPNSIKRVIILSILRYTRHKEQNMKNKNMAKAMIMVLVFVSILASVKPAKAQLILHRDITFPVIGKVSYGDDFGYPRSGGRTHEGNDIMGTKLLPLVAVADGTISYVNYPEPDWGYSIGIRDSEGYQYWYLHMNNDNPKTDDGKGGGFFAYAPDMVRGAKVVKGQLIGFMGDSGNAESTTAHLHFEIHMPDGTPFDPYQSLKTAVKVTQPVLDYPQQENEILPYGNFASGASIALGNFDSDTNLEIVSGALAGGGPLVRTFEQDGTALKSFYAYDPNFRGGIDVATGDVDGDGIDEIITSAGSGGGPHIKVFKADGTLFSEFLAYNLAFHGGVNLATVDVDSDGKAEIITAPASLGGPHIRIFKPTGIVVSEYFAYDKTFTKGLDVSASTYGNNQVAIVTAPNSGGGPHIKVFDKTGLMQSEFFAYDGKFFGGVRVSASRASSQSSSQLQIVTVPASTGGPHVRVFDSLGAEQKGELTGFEAWWVGGYDIASKDGKYFISSKGGRRTSLREAFSQQQNNNSNGSGNFFGGRRHFGD